MEDHWGHKNLDEVVEQAKKMINWNIPPHLHSFNLYIPSTINWVTQQHTALFAMHNQYIWPHNISASFDLKSSTQDVAITGQEPKLHISHSCLMLLTGTLWDWHWSWAVRYLTRTCLPQWRCVRRDNNVASSCPLHPLALFLCAVRCASVNTYNNAVWSGIAQLV
jgi:hypothetical protein